MKVLLPVLLLALSGCATILHGTTQEIPITSEPSGADVTVGDLKATTPARLELARGTPHTVQIAKEGYRTETVQLEKVISGAVAGNIIAGGLIGWGIDAASGAQYKLVPDSIHATLMLDQNAAKPAAQPFEAQLVALEGMRERGVITAEEYTTMRRRLVETFSAEALRVLATPQPPAPPPWIIGIWEGQIANRTYGGGGSARIEFTQADKVVRWQMTQRIKTLKSGSETNSASGTIVQLSERAAILDGTYDAGGAAKYELRRTADRLEGYSAIADPWVTSISLKKQ